MQPHPWPHRRWAASRRAWLGSVMAGIVSGLVLALVGCVTVEGTLPRPIPRVPSAASPTGWLAGAAEIDITPPPGFATAGHSLESALSVGVWTRLHARALYFEDAAGVPLVLVACDLWGIEPGLVDRVAQRLHAHPGLEHVGREHLILAATHTHHGPGNVSSSRLYGTFAGGEPGHDRALMDMLVDRIAAAIAEAAASRRPATITRHAVAIPRLARNRSLDPLLRDPEAKALIEAAAGLPGCPELVPVEGVDPCTAVDPVLEAYRVTAADGDTIAVAGFFAMHPTAMPNKTALHHADVFGVATAHAAAALARADRSRPVVALFNGAEGDVSPHWDPQGRPSTMRLGHALGRALVTALDEPGRPVEGAITVAYGWQPIAAARWTDPEGQPHRTARAPRSGKGQLGGAEDGRTRLYDLGWREGKRRRRPRRGPQGSKRPALPWPLAAATPPRWATPREVPLTVVTLGDVVLVTLPGEHTTVLGRRIVDAVAQARPDASVVRPIGLANAYLSYFTTPEEYARQHYEGASMLYGEQAGMLIAHDLAALARDGSVERRTSYRYRAGRAHRWSLDRPALRRALDEVEPRIAGQLDTGPLLGLPRLYFHDVVPTWPVRDPRARLTPRVRIQAWSTTQRAWIDYAPGGTPVDDRGGAMVTLLTHVQDEGTRLRWGVWWIEPGAEPHQPLRFFVDTVGRAAICSEPFTLSQWFRPQGPGVLAPTDCLPARAPDDAAR